jgi:hypothetical protein
MSWKMTVALGPAFQIIGSPVGKGTLFRGGDQAAQRDNFHARFLIEAHNGGLGPVEISEHANTAAETDTLAHPKSALTLAVQDSFTSYASPT